MGSTHPLRGMSTLAGLWCDGRPGERKVLNLVRGVVKFSELDFGVVLQMVDLFGTRTKELLGQAQNLLEQAQGSMAEDIRDLQTRQISTDARLARLERDQAQSQKETAQEIAELKEKVDSLRDSAIRGEIASGERSCDVARKFDLSPSRITQIAPRRRYNNG